MATGLALSAVARLPFTWDGAWFFARAMDTGTPTFLYRRAIHVLIQAPALATRAFVDDPAVLSLVFSAAYAMVPLVALFAAWRVVRDDRPDLIVWPVLGIALVAVPGQAFFISESTIVAHLAWPIVLAALLGRIRRHRVMVAGLALAIAVSHPYGGPALAAVGVVALVSRSWSGGSGRPWAAALLVLTGATLILASLALRSSYEADASSLERLIAQFRGGVWGPIAIAPVAAWAIGLGAFVHLRERARLAATTVMLAATVLVLVPWALDPAAWGDALRYRAWLLFLTLPLFVMAVIDARRSSPWIDRRLVTVGAPAVMALVLAAQSLSWVGLQTRLAVSLAATPPGCVLRSQVDWIESTALDHWATTSLGIVLEGRSPDHLVLIDRPCDGAVDAARVTIKLTPFDRDDRPVPGWWGFNDLVAAWETGR
jgi:hypothetical protein